MLKYMVHWGQGQQGKKMLNQNFDNINLFCQNFGSPKVLNNHQNSALGIGGL